MLDIGRTLLQREVSSTPSRRRAYRDLYGNRSLISELDIVNELDGHSGCVNALSWSKSGRLLASGSDDQHLNIHTYHPEDSTKQFRLQTTVATGHTQNIFSVKFMPQSNDRTVVTCAGDNAIRVFDLEYAGKSTEASSASARAAAGRRARRNNVYNGVRYLSDGNTNVRVYRSHRDRVKRIVTESSPYLFLTCSEDGEVRQWDTRQPSEAYPRQSWEDIDDDDISPPLISYRHYQLDLNTISCSASQPHYIALGGAHLHCFLHDRRMAGRDVQREAGWPGGVQRDKIVREATQCVRRFAPGGEGRHDRGHITACKISDSRPDEMVVSWSGDHIYSFDLVRSADADDVAVPSVASEVLSNRVRPNTELKRKRAKDNSDTSLNEGGSQRQARAEALEDATAFRIHYQNGQQEDIALRDNTSLTHEQNEAQRIIKSILHLRRLFFTPAVERQDQTSKYTQVLGRCAILLPDIDEVIREWTYPMNPSPEQVTIQRQLRGIRESLWRCVQAVGTLSRVLGGRLQTPSGTSPLTEEFATIRTRTNQLAMSGSEIFTFDFIKAILVWLDSGRGKVIETFTRPKGVSKSSSAGSRLPIAEDEADEDAIEDHLLPYFRSLLSDRSAEGAPILDPETNRFLSDDARQLFSTDVDALDAFIEEVEKPFADLSSHTEGSIDRQAAKQTWALRVARGMLMRSFNNIDMSVAEAALGGVRTISDLDIAQASELESVVEEEDEHDIDVVEVIAQGTQDTADNGSAPSGSLGAEESDDDMDLQDERDHGDDMEDSEDDPIQAIYARQKRERRRLRSQIRADVPFGSATRTYKGHCNIRTVKDVNYFGLEDEYVVSGSDDGNLFIWDRKTTELVNILEGDEEVVNVVQGHPYETMLAVSGIDHTIKIFSPDQRAREVARLGTEVTAQDPATFSSLAWPNRLGHLNGIQARSSTLLESTEAQDAEQDDFVAATGLRSRKRMPEAHQIMERNDRSRRQGDNDAVFTVSPLEFLRYLQSLHGAIPGFNA